MLAGKGDNMATPAAMVALLAKLARASSVSPARARATWTSCCWP